MKKHLDVLRYVLPRRITAVALLVLSCGMATLRTNAQGYLNASQQWGLSGADAANKLIADNSGNSYLLATVAANTFPVTILPAPTGTTRKSILVKMDADGNTIWARYLPLSATGNTTISEMVLSNGELYLLGSTVGTDIPTTNGSVAGGGGSDIIYARVNASNGTVLNTAYLGGSGAESTGLKLEVENGSVYITYTTTSTDIPVTNASAFTTGYDHVVQKLTNAGNIIYSTYTSSVATAVTNTEQVSFAVENGKAYLGLVVSSTHNFTVTNGSTVQGSYDFGIIKLDANGNRAFSTVYGGTANEIQPVIVVNNENIYLSGHSTSSNYPATDGSAHPNAPQKRVLTRFNSNGAVIFSSNQAGVDTYVDAPRMQWYNGTLYLMGATRRVGVSSVYIPTFNLTSSTTGYHFLTKVDPSTGQTIFATRFGPLPQSVISGSDFVVDNGRIYTIVSSGSGASFTTDGFNKISGLAAYFTVHNTDGNLLFASDKFGGAAGVTINAIAANGNNVYMVQTAQSAGNFILTKPVIGITNSSDIAWASYKFCPPMPITNEVLPATQTICMGGFTQPITGNKVSFAAANIPMIYRAAVPVPQMEILARYQWQVATTATGPWTSIAGQGTQKDFTPPVTSANRFYRRVVLNPAGCNDTVSISAVAQVIVSGNTAPSVTGAIFNTCTNTAVNIAVSASGGTPPYSFAWDNGLASTTATATATPISNSVYTATVTDNNGCKQIGQAIVNAYAADAGPATVSSCAGSPVRIGTAPPAGLAGVTYSWSPTTGLDNATIAQPLANPATTTVYTLSMTIPASGGGNCTTTDQITVNVVAAPVNTSFAGADKAVCIGGSLSLGTTAESGFTYTWAPGNYLNTSAGSTVTFNAGSEQPTPNSITYFVTATSNGCTFFDEVNVSVLEVDAGKTLCGPRTVGTGDKISGVSGKIFFWEKVSGPGNITGATNTANTTVSASTGASTTYRLTVSYLGVSCSDLVVVPECSAGSGAGCPDLDIEVIAAHGCPSTTFGSVTLNAKPANLSAADWTYSWSAAPAGGLSATTGTSITLTDNIERDITLRVTSVDNPSFSCTKTIHVNGPSWALPAFTAQDHSICAATTVSLGATAVAGYSYNWAGVGNAQRATSNPTATPLVTTDYYATVTDNLSGCITRDTATVTIKPLIADPGSDWTTCSNVVVQLGSTALPGYSYSWSPSVASYQGGTSFTSAEPKILVATSQDFTLTVTDAATGCSKDSTVHVVIDNSPNLPAIANKTICAGASTTIGNAPLNNVDYSWSPSTGLSSATVAQPVASPSVTQTYTLTITYKDAAGSPACTKSGNVTVTVNAPQITMRDTTICPSAALYNLGTNVTTATVSSYLWTPAFLVTSPAALSATVKANPSTPTTYTLTITDANGCRTSASKTVSSTIAAPDAGSNSMVCVGTSLQLGATSNTGTINWTVTPAIAGTLNTASSPAPVFAPASGDAGKSFVFTISQNNAGCTSTAQATVVVKELTLPTMPVQTICANGSTTIGVAAQPNINYVWDPATDLSDPYAATTIANNISSTRIYTLTAIDFNGCFATSQAVVGVNPTPAPTVTIPDVTTTVGVTPSAFNPQINPGAGTYAYNWTPANQLDNPYIKNATARPGGIGNTTYALALTDANGCTSTAQTQLRVVASTPLPITISSFTAVAKKCAVSLSWDVQSANNFADFVVERSSNGIEFTTVKKIGYEAYRAHYTYEDANVGSGKWLYRLKLVDLTGEAKYSRIEAATVSCTTNATLSVFPNPVSNYVQINSSKPVQRIALISYTGSVVVSQTYNQDQAALIQLPFNNNLSPGMYMLMVWDTDSTIQQVKLVKE